MCKYVQRNVFSSDIAIGRYIILIDGKYYRYIENTYKREI